MQINSNIRKWNWWYNINIKINSVIYFNNINIMGVVLQLKILLLANLIYLVEKKFIILKININIYIFF